jgi:carbon storage regulator
MLILTRRTGEAVMIGLRTKFTVLGVRDGLVRIGFDAPKEIPIHREEVYERIQRELLKEDTPEHIPETPL